MQDLQFYPTGLTLSRKAFSKFKNKRVRRLLEPSAGRGDLLAGYFESLHPYNRGECVVDCVEIDLNNQAILRSKKLSVVGSDFLNFNSPTQYSHILMNPSFGVACQHVLHAWRLLHSGELVAIINAETLKNPFSKERQLLAKLLEDHSGSPVEYLQEAFMTEDTQRVTTVEIAIIHLVKQGTGQSGFIHGLRRTVDQKWGGAAGLEQLKNQVMLPSSDLENRVMDFRCAVEALIQSEDAKARYATLFGRLDTLINEEPLPADAPVPLSIEEARNEAINKDYIEIKSRAWAGVLKSSQIADRLSTAARERLYAEFDEVKKLEFDIPNILGFIQGVVSQQGQIQIEMLMDVFDLFTKYRTDNRCYYQGWKSNDKHRTCAYRLKMSRMVLPSKDRSGYAWRSCVSYQDTQLFQDIDRVFALLDGKHHSAIQGLESLFSTDATFKQLSQGERLSSDYFDVRFFPGTGTFHFFPRRADLIDRLNRAIGKHRNWLPHDESAAAPAFWAQYDKAEKVTNGIASLQIDWRRLQHGEPAEQQREADKLHAALVASQDACGLTPWEPALPPPPGQLNAA